MMSRFTGLTQARFRGSLLGVLVGDCFGAPFEGKSVDPTSLMAKIEELTKPDSKLLRYTDDTAMTMSTCISLVKNKGLKPAHMAQEYSESFFKEPKRGYGAAVKQVFLSLRDSNYRNPYEPAAKQFDGNGSYGNGAAMRCNGIALFAHKNRMNARQTAELVTDCSKLTHSHVYGINGAVLLVAAIKYVLSLDEDTFDENEFLDHLIKGMTDIEEETDRMYTGKLKSIKRVVDQTSIAGIDVTQDEIVALLGNDVSAHHSVPLAIYSFIRGNSRFNDGYRLENEFVRTLHWAISCGGDTDTIASMACGLCGAYLGKDKIPEFLYKKCESWEVMIKLADLLST